MGSQDSETYIQDVWESQGIPRIEVQRGGQELEKRLILAFPLQVAREMKILTNDDGRPTFLPEE